MIQARLYRPSKTSMQSGKAKTHAWVLEFIDPNARYREPVMGWNATECTLYQSKLCFDTMEEALAYTASKGITPTILREEDRAIPVKSYSDNFTKGLRF